MASHDRRSGGVPDWRSITMAFCLYIAQLSPGRSPETLERPSSSLSDDCGHRLRAEYGIDNPSDEQIESLALSFIPDLLQKNSSDLDKHRLPLPVHEFQSNRCIH